MPAIVVASIIGAAAAAGSAKIQSNAAKNAAKTQARSTEQALTVQQQNLQQQQTRLQPYQQLGTAALGRLGQIAGVPPPAPSASAAPLVPNQAQPRMAMGAMGSQPMKNITPVQMRAPNGMVKSIPMDQVAHFESLGAVRV
jgi:type II secretory pathway pseudopilin PulG